MHNKLELKRRNPAVQRRMARRARFTRNEEFLGDVAKLLLEGPHSGEFIKYLWEKAKKVPLGFEQQQFEALQRIVVMYGAPARPGATITH